MKYRALDVVLGVATLAFTFFFFVPLTIYLLNQREFLSTPGEMARLLAMAAAGATFAGTALFLGIGASSRRYTVPLLAALSLAVWIQGYLFNWNYGHFDGSELTFHLLDLRAADIMVWGALAVVLLGVGIWKQPSFRTLFIILLLMQGASIYMSTSGDDSAAILPEDSEEDAAFISQTHQYTFSEKQNIIFLVLDAFQTDVFNEYLEAHPELKEELPGFTYYPDALATSYFTGHSVPVIFTGRTFDTKTTFNEYIRNAYQEYSMTGRLKKAGYHVGVYNYFSLAQGAFRPEVLNDIVDNYSGLQEQVNSYYGHEVRRILLTGLFRMSPHIARNAIYTRWLLEAPLEQDRDIFAHEFEHYSRLSGPQPRFNYYHLQGLHQPVVVDGERLNWQDREVNLRVAALLCDLMKAFVGRIQRLGIYDDAAIFIIADHGLQWESEKIHYGQFVPQTDELPSQDVFAKKPRALPLILFKPPQARGTLLVSERPVSLKDIAPTVLDIAGLDYQTDYEGKSLLRSEEHWRVRPFYTSEYKKRGTGPLYEYAVTGFSWHDSSWKFTGRVHYRGRVSRLALNNYVPGTELTFGFAGTGQEYLDESWVAEEGAHLSTGARSAITLPVEVLRGSPMLRAVVSPVAANGPIASPQVQMRINGQVSETFTLTDKTMLQLPVPLDGMSFTEVQPPKAKLRSAWLAVAPEVVKTGVEIIFEIIDARQDVPVDGNAALEAGLLRLHTLTLSE